jgi:hypothetical protein
VKPVEIKRKEGRPSSAQVRATSVVNEMVVTAEVRFSSFPPFWASTAANNQTHHNCTLLSSLFLLLSKSNV